MRSRVMLLTVAVALAVASCGGSESTDATSPAAVATTSPPTTVPPTSTTITMQDQPDAGPFPAGEPVDLLVLSDSGGCCGGVAASYAPFAAEALDREVRIHDQYIGGVADILDWVRGPTGSSIAEAEVIVLYGHPAGFEYNLPLPNINACFAAVDAVEYPEEYEGEWTPGEEWPEIPVVPAVEDWQPLRDALDQIYDQIWELRDGQPTIVRAYDIYNGSGVSAWAEVGIEEECTANWEVQTQVVREAAEAKGAGFVSLYDIFNGPNHDEEPREKGWISEDGFHANDEGNNVIAEALAAIGFEVSEPPR